MTHRPRSTAAVALLLGLAVLSGCSGSSGSTAGSAAAPARVGAGEVGAPAAGAAGAGSAVLLGRRVVRTATLAVEVPDVRVAADRSRTVAQDAGGALEAEDASGTGDVLRLRVAPERLPTALEALAGLGRERARTVGSEDVSDQVADLDSRLATQRASVERVRALLAKAQVIADVVALEAQLAQREGDLESLQARAAVVRGQADLATITVTLSPLPPAAAPATGFRDGIASGAGAFLGASRAGAVVLGALLPFLPLLALGLWLARRLTRRPAAT